MENVAEGLVDLAERLGLPEEMHETLIAEAEQVQVRYDTLWELLHAEPVFGFTDRYRVEGTIRRLNDLGFAVDELSLQPDGADPSRMRVRVAVGDRRYHAQHLQELTGLDVGEGQAAHPARRSARVPGAVVPWRRATTSTSRRPRGCG